MSEDDPPPPPSPPKPKVTKLPPNWKMAKDSEGKTYYYHTVTRYLYYNKNNKVYIEGNFKHFTLQPLIINYSPLGTQMLTISTHPTSKPIGRSIF